MPRIALHPALLAAAAALTPPALAQSSSAPLDQTHQDVGPLSTSLYVLPPLPGAPRDFEEVYRVPGRDDLLMRRSGAITAVFPRSTYVYSEREGVYATVPPGVVFQIGDPCCRFAMQAIRPALLSASSGDEIARRAVITSLAYVNSRADGRAPSSSATTSAAPSIIAASPEGRALPQAPAASLAPEYSESTAPDAATASAPGAPTQPPPATLPPPTIVTNEAYRRARIAEILRSAAAAPAPTR